MVDAASSAPASVASPSKGWNIGMWVLSVLLAAAFGMGGSMKLMKSFAELVADPRMEWVNAVGPGMVKFIGASEVLGALGLILPSATRIQPKLTWIAAL